MCDIVKNFIIDVTSKSGLGADDKECEQHSLLSSDGCKYCSRSKIQFDGARVLVQTQLKLVISVCSGNEASAVEHVTVQ